MQIKDLFMMVIESTNIQKKKKNESEPKGVCIIEFVSEYLSPICI